MKRPYTICHILSALDGKITGDFMETKSAREVSEEYGRIRSEYQARHGFSGKDAGKAIDWILEYLDTHKR